MTFTSYAQNFEDVLLNRVFAGFSTGFYVDIGASHPVIDSVTKAFYDRGWTGLNIEPGDVFPQLSYARPRDINLNIAVYDRVGEISFAQYPKDRDGLSYVEDDLASDSPATTDEQGVRIRTVRCDTLTNILESLPTRQHISFLKIDCEGAELAIIRSTNWREIRPTILVIEATKTQTNELANYKWEPILLEQGYIRAYFDGINCFYIPDENQSLLQHFTVPVNVLDNFIRANEATYLERLHELEQRITGLIEKNRISRQKLKELENITGGLPSQINSSKQLIFAAETLYRLIDQLTWPDGPKAIKAVLPLARLLRSLTQTGKAGTAKNETLYTHSTDQPTIPASIAQPKIDYHADQTLKTRVLLAIYAPFRPFIRPVAWRGRSFLIGELRIELTKLHQKVDEITQGSLRAEDTENQKYSDSELKETVKMLEKIMLTLALQHTNLK